MRLHFNKIGYKIYGKEQSRRVPSHRAKPGNPGYGFRLARWRDTLRDEEDRVHCEHTLRSIACSEEFIERVKAVVQEYHDKWERVRRPSRPAGPGRPRRLEGEADPYEGLSDDGSTSGDMSAVSRKRRQDHCTASGRGGVQVQETSPWYLMGEYCWRRQAPWEPSLKRPNTGPSNGADHTTHESLWPSAMVDLPAQSAASVLSAGLKNPTASYDASSSCSSRTSMGPLTSSLSATNPRSMPPDLELTLPPLRFFGSTQAALPGLIRDSRESSPLQRSSMSRSVSLQDLADGRGVTGKPASKLEYDGNSALGVLASLVCSSTV